jgi:hypothetical protein
MCVYFQVKSPVTSMKVHCRNAHDRLYQRQKTGMATYKALLYTYIQKTRTCIICRRRNSTCLKFLPMKKWTHTDAVYVYGT